MTIWKGEGRHSLVRCVRPSEGEIRCSTGQLLILTQAKKVSLATMVWDG